MGTQKSYNGFSGAERDLIWAVQKQLKAQKVMSWDDKPCCMCKGGGLIMPHLENYFKPEEFYPMCVPCHMSLHARFSSKNGWIDYLNKINSGWQPPVFTIIASYFNSPLNKQFWRQGYTVPTFDSGLWFNDLTLDQAQADRTKSDLISLGDYTEDTIKQLYSKIVLGR